MSRCNFDRAYRRNRTLAPILAGVVSRLARSSLVCRTCTLLGVSSGSNLSDFQRAVFGFCAEVDDAVVHPHPQAVIHVGEAEFVDPAFTAHGATGS